MAVMTLAQARENFLAAMQTLRSSKVRSALTVLGIVIGITAFVSRYPQLIDAVGMNGVLYFFMNVRQVPPEMPSRT